MIFKKSIKIFNNLNDIHITLTSKCLVIFVRICYSHSLISMKQLIEITPTTLSDESHTFCILYYFRTQRNMSICVFRTYSSNAQQLVSICQKYQSAG